MHNARRIYNLLLNLYPRNYRKAFGTEMMQTFLDSYQDVEKAKGREVLSFWLLMITDEARNITFQHMEPLREENHFLTVTPTKLVLLVTLMFPLFAVLLATCVKVSLALPHPHVSGLGVLFALGGLLFLSGVLSLVASYLFASGCTFVFAGASRKRKVRTA